MRKEFVHTALGLTVTGCANFIHWGKVSIPGYLIHTSHKLTYYDLRSEFC